MFQGVLITETCSPPFCFSQVGAEAKELIWADVEGMKTEKFTQKPLVFASVATDRSDGAVDVRLPENTPTQMKMELQGSSTAEKISYLPTPQPTPF